MELDIDLANVPEAVRSPSQRARVATERWASDNLPCPRCGGVLRATRPGTPGDDFVCAGCRDGFQLKFAATGLHRLIGGEFKKTQAEILSGRPTHWLVGRYERVSPHRWRVKDLSLYVGRFVQLHAIEKRPPLSERSRRPGWTGCYVLLDRVQQFGRVALVWGGNVVPEHHVRAIVATIEGRIAGLSGWQLLVYSALGAGRNHTLPEVYARCAPFAAQYPKNRHATAKIRQCLQNLARRKLAEPCGAGLWRVI